MYNLCFDFYTNEELKPMIFRYSIEKDFISGASIIIVFTSHIRHIRCSVVFFLCVLPLPITVVFVVCYFDFLQIACCMCRCLSFHVSCSIFHTSVIGVSVMLIAHFVYFLPFAVYFCWFLLMFSSFNLMHLAL